MQASDAQAKLPDMADILSGPAEPPGRDENGLSTPRWLQEGLRAAFFQAPRVAGHPPAPWQLLLITGLVLALDLALSRLDVAGPALFDVQAWLSTWWSAGLGLALAWWALPGASRLPGPGADRPERLAGVSTFFTLWLAAGVPNLLLTQGLVGAIVQGWLVADWFSEGWFFWALYIGSTVWYLVVSAVLLQRFIGWRPRLLVFVLALLAAVGLNLWQFEARSWVVDPSRAGQARDKPRLRLSQETLEAQQALWQRTVDAIALERPGVADVYGLVFAPYAAEDVFLRESTLVSRVLAERFDAEGRVLQLLNHATTATTHPWATPLNLQRAIEALARRMDRDNDVLVVYMTSHGARDFKLAASHWPLEVAPVGPAELRNALDQAGIRHRVIGVSACYSGGWVDVLAGEHTLVMTAADAEHTSYGCGQLSELTFFGRALFDEQLRQTHSFEQAFARAVPVIAQREIDAGKDDGFSNPQISVGAGIRPVLRALERRLAGAPQTAAKTQP